MLNVQMNKEQGTRNVEPWQKIMFNTQCSMLNVQMNKEQGTRNVELKNAQTINLNS